MKANKLSELFLTWFQTEYPEARIYRNNTGIAWRDGKDGKKYPVKFGIPLPQGKKKGGGGSDFIAFIPSVVILKSGSVGLTATATGVRTPSFEYLRTVFYEIKTATDKQSKNQKDFADQITRMGGEYYLVHELHDKSPLEKEKLYIYDHGSDFYIEKWSVN